MQSIPLLIPPKQEQTAIANALFDVDNLIAALETQIAKKSAIKTAAMQQLLTGKTRLPSFGNQGDSHLTGSRSMADATHIKDTDQTATRLGYKQTELGEIPEDWDAMQMGGLASIQRGASPRPIDSPIWFDRNSKTGWLRISDVSKASKFLLETTQNLSNLGIENSRYVASDNLVMSICATVGKPVITKKDLCIHDGFVVFNKLSIDVNFMYYVLKDLEKDWGKQGQTGSQMNLNTELINTTYVSIPRDKKEQTAIAVVLSDMDAELDDLQQRLDKTQLIKQGMMQELLTGKTRLIKPLEEVVHE